MTTIMEIYQRERERLERELDALHDSKSAIDSLCVSLERMRLEYCEKSSPAERSEANRLFDVARQSAKCMYSVSGIGMNVLKDEAHTPTKADQLVAALPMAGILIGAALTCWLLIEDMNVPALLAAALTAVAWLETQVIYRRRIAVAAVTKVNRHELLRLTDRLMEALEDALEQSAQQRRLTASQAYLTAGEQPMLNADMLEPMQMLLEAEQTNDGEYALKALPKMRDALLAQGIEAVMYSKENEHWFDMYPSCDGGITIRPALIKDGKLVVRGQATEQSE